MTFILSILALIITFLGLSNGKIETVIKIALTTILAGFIFRWWFGSYHFWLDEKSWTEQNISSYVKTTFLKAVISFGFVWIFYYVVLLRFLKVTIVTRPMAMAKKINKNSWLSNYKKAMGNIIKYGTVILGAPRVEDFEHSYDEYVTIISTNIPFILQALTVWILIYGTSSWAIISYVIVALLAIFILFSPINEDYFKEILRIAKDELEKEVYYEKRAN